MSALVLSTHDTREWQALVHRHFLSLHCEFARPRAMSASARALSFGALRAAEMQVDASRVSRSRRDADADDAGHFKVLWQLGGQSRIAQGVREACLRPGQWAVYDTRREYQIDSAERSHFVVLLMPQSLLPEGARTVEALAGRAMSAQGLPRVVLASLLAILRDEAVPDSPGQQLMADSTVALLDHALHTQAAPHLRARPTLRHPDRLAEVQAWVQRRLDDPTLNASTVAEALGLSRRSLYSLFAAAQITPGHFILQARMAQACQWLSDPARAHLTIREVARRCGFTDPAHFSRAFVGAHGCAPSVWRARTGPAA